MDEALEADKIQIRNDDERRRQNNICLVNENRAKAHVSILHWHHFAKAKESTFIYFKTLKGSKTK